MNDQSSIWKNVFGGDTFQTHIKGMTFDYIYLKGFEAFSDAKVLFDVKASDHFPLTVRLTLPTTPVPTTPVWGVVDINEKWIPYPSDVNDKLRADFEAVYPASNGETYFIKINQSGSGVQTNIATNRERHVELRWN